MAGASADGEVNHWPAFVDVLTTVIMVVTFLLVIMSAAVMQLSKRVIQNYKQQLVAQNTSPTPVAAQQGQPSTKLQTGGPPGPVANRLNSPQDADAGTSVAELGAVLRSETVVNGTDKLTIRTRETKDTLAIQVKSTEQPDASKGVEVKTSDTLLKVGFAPTAINYDDENASRVIGFLKGKVAAGTKYEIWSFTPQTGSVTEAERLGYYRAAMTRNLLIKAGIAPTNIATQVRVTDPKAADGHMVRVVIKP